MPKNLGKLASLGLLVALTLSACRSDEFGRAYANERRAALLAKSGGRFTPGRLVDVPWSPVREPPQAQVANPAVPVGAAEFRGEGVAVYSPLESASRGFALLVDRGEGQSADSVLRRFELAWEAGQSDPAFLNDYAAALLERGLPRDFILGGEYAARALEAAELDDPRADLAQAARFNWAFAIKRLALHGQATKAWQVVLDHETDSHWRAEAEAHLEDLAQWPVARWPQVRPEVRAAAARGDVETVVRLLPDFRTAIRLLAEDEELKTWAETVETDPPRAAEALTVARTIGAALAPTDRFLADVVAGIDGVEGNVKKTAELAGAVRGFFEGLGAYQERDFERSSPQLVQAASSLRQFDSALAYRAEAVGLFSAVHLSLSDVLAGSDRWLATPPGPAYAALYGQVIYYRGWVRSRAGYHRASLGDLETSVQAMTDLGEDLAASYGSHFGSILDLAGDPRAVEADDTWLERATRSVDSYHRYFVAHAVVFRASELKPKAPAVSRAADLEAASLADSMGLPIHTAETHADLYLAFLDLGQSEEARHHWQQATQAIASLRSARPRQTSQALLDWNAGNSSRASADARERFLRYALNGFSGLERASEAQVTKLAEQRHYALHQLLLFEALSKLKASQGDAPAAAAYASQALDLIAGRFETGRESARGGAIAAQVRSLSTLVLQGEVAFGRSLEPLFDSVEWAYRLASPGRFEEAKAERLAAALPAESALVYLVPLPHQLLVYRLLPGEEEPEAQALLVPGLIGQIDCLDPRTAGPSCGSWRPDATRFAREAIEPWLCSLERDTRLYVVAGALGRVPLAGLPIQCAGEPEEAWVDRHVTQFAASGASFLASHERSEALGGRTPPRSVFAVGVSEGRSAPRLEAVADEARRVAALYPSGAALLDTEATEAAVLSAVGEADVLHFATHGELDPNDQADSFLSVADGFLTVRDLGSLAGRLANTRLAVLAACDTGGSVVGVEGLVGVSRAFLDLGVPTVVATQSGVHDQASAALMVRFHELYRETGDAALALAEAQREAAAREGMKKEDGPPEWAKWVVVGG